MKNGMRWRRWPTGGLSKSGGGGVGRELVVVAQRPNKYKWNGTGLSKVSEAEKMRPPGGGWRENEP